MARINLLPWREELRRQRRTEYLAALGLCAVFAVAGWFGVHLFYTDWIEYQEKRNTFLTGQIRELDKQIAEIRRLEKEKQNLISRMQAIESLQTSRPLVVYLFDELVSTLPEGVFLTNVTQKGSTISVQGIAQSNARVSSYMRNIENSSRLQGAKLSVIETAGRGVNRDAKFALTFSQRIEKSGDGEEEDL